MRSALTVFALCAFTTLVACSELPGSGDTPPPATASARASDAPVMAASRAQGPAIATIVTHDAKVRILGGQGGELKVVVYKADGTIIADGISLEALRSTDPTLHAIVTSATASSHGGGTTYVDALLAL